MPKKAIQKSIIPGPETIASRIYFVRGQKVMLDRDLAELYGVQTKVLKQAVRRNINRFPFDFMFELTKEELEDWRSQFVTSNSDKMGLRHTPMAFTEQGVAMLSSVLKATQPYRLTSRLLTLFNSLRTNCITHIFLRVKSMGIFTQVLQRTSSKDFNSIIKAR